MSYTIEHLSARDAREALDFLNMVFSMARVPHDFSKALPKMWGDNGERVKYHLAIREEGHIRALVGVYPLPVRIGGEELMFYTMGNVATHAHFSGRGYMSALLDRAMQELRDANADAGRLGGLRQRYGRYGYEPCGSRYNFTLNKNNVLRFFNGNFDSDITFRQLTAEDTEELLFAKSLFDKSGIRVDRVNLTTFWESVTAWSSVPFLALRGKEPVGYLSADQEKSDIREFAAVDDETARKMLCAWQHSTEKTLSFPVEPWQASLCATMQPLCEGWKIELPSHFCVFNWDRVVNALLKLKASYTPLLRGSCTVGIEGYGTLRLTVDAGGVSCRKTDETAATILTHAEASRFFFGPMPAACTVTKAIDPLLLSWLPLPLGWNMMDRV